MIYLSINTNMIAAAPQNEQPKMRCRYCPIRKNRFTMQRCGICKFPICKEHTMTSKSTCTSCATHGEDSDTPPMEKIPMSKY